MTPPLRRVRWRPSWRLVPSRFPPTGLFDRVARPEDLETVIAIEGLTNDRLREEIGELSLIPEGERLCGPGTTPIMAAFTHLNASGSRFTDGSYGVYYAARTVETAVTETVYRRERFLAATAEPPIEIDMRAYAADIDTRLHDIRGCQESLPGVYDPDPDRYASAQALARELRADGSNGIVYDSVRHTGGQCVAVFRPRALRPAVQGLHYCFVWDGRVIDAVYVKQEFRT